MNSLINMHKFYATKQQQFLGVSEKKNVSVPCPVYDASTPGKSCRDEAKKYHKKVNRLWDLIWSEALPILLNYQSQ